MATPMSFSIVPSGAVTPAVGTSVIAPQAVPNGMSPSGKRPRSDQAAASGRPPLSPAETSTAVLEMQPLVRSTAEAVQWNCDLLNAVIGRVNTLESWTKVAEPQVTKAADFIAEHPPKLSELAGFGDQIKAAFAAVKDVAAQADVRLRQEISQVTAVIDQAIGTLNQQADALELATTAAHAAPHSTATAGVPSPAPGLGGQAEQQLAELNAGLANSARSLSRPSIASRKPRSASLTTTRACASLT